MSGFLFLFMIVVISRDMDFSGAAFVSILSALSIDFFFVEPVFSLSIADQEGLFTLSVFLITSLVVTKLGASARHLAAISQQRQVEAEQIYKISEQMLHILPGEESGKALIQPFMEVLNLQCVCLIEPESKSMIVCGESKAHLEAKTREALAADADRDEVAEGVAIRCLRAAGIQTGAIGFEGLGSGLSMASQLAALAASALQRIRAYRRANDSAAEVRLETLRAAILDALAHEFKTPLATILTAAGGIQEVGLLSAEQTELAQLVENEAARLGSLTSRLLKTVRIDREQVKPNRVPVDLVDLMTSIVSRQEEMWPEYYFDVRGGEGNMEVHADYELIVLVLNQLMDNACKYAKPGSTVEIQFARSLEQVSVRIWSRTPEIPDAEKPLVFDRFFRGNRTKGQTAGTGLGLYVARKIALAHDGDLTLEPAVGQRGGNAFCLQLPVAERRAGHVEGA